MENRTPSPDIVNKKELLPSPEKRMQGSFKRMQEMCINFLDRHEERAMKIDATFANTFDQVGFRTFQMTLILGALASFNHARTRYTVHETNTPSGIEYVHQDPDTTSILNYLSGKSDLPEHMKLEIFKPGIAKLAKSYGHTLPDNFEQLSEKELRTLVVKIVTPDPSDLDTSTPQEITAHWYLKMLVPQYEWNPRLHAKLWELEKETGSPKIHITFEGPLLDSGNERAFYSPVTNTVNIFMSGAFHDLIAELAHAKQVEDSNLLKNIQGIGNMFKVGFDAIFKYQSMNEAYEVSYKTPGSFEHDAHYIKELQLRAKLDGEEPKIKGDSTLTQQTIIRR